MLAPVMAHPKNTAFEIIWNEPHHDLEQMHLKHQAGNDTTETLHLAPT